MKKQKNKSALASPNSKLRQAAKSYQLYIMLIPFVLYFILFAYRPMAGLVIAFKKYSVYGGISGSPWVGFDNFTSFFNGPYFGRLIKNTVIISLYQLAFGFPASIVLALLLNEVKNKFFKSTVQTLTYIPHFISVVVIAGIVTNFLSPSNGIINIIIEALGGEKTYFLSQAKYFRTIYTTMTIWAGLGYSTIVYLSSLSGIDQQLYEACMIDGGGKLRQLWHVTLPGILPTIVILFIIRIGSIMNVGYETIILLYQPSTYETADIINTDVYRMGMEQGNYSLAAAVGLFNSVIGFVLVMATNKISNKVTGAGLW